MANPNDARLTRTGRICVGDVFALPVGNPVIVQAEPERARQQAESAVGLKSGSAPA
jgi:hypothetical protein